MGNSVPVYPADQCMPRRRTPHDALADNVMHLRVRLRLWRERARTRRQLAAMGERDLNDLGLSPSSVEYEINKAFWET